jgi:hypothetical protein
VLGVGVVVVCCSCWQWQVVLLLGTIGGACFVLLLTGLLVDIVVHGTGAIKYKRYKREIGRGAGGLRAAGAAG